MSAASAIPRELPDIPHRLLEERPDDAPDGESVPGWVVAIFSNRYDVVTYCEGASSCVLQATVKATLKKAGTDVLVGDMVWLSDIDSVNDSARIVGVWPRTSQLQRPKIANVGHVLLVHPLTQPEYDGEQLDRYLALVHAAGLNVSICFTKADLLGDTELINELQRCYGQQLGYDVHVPDFNSPESYQGIQNACRGRLTVLAGLSGAGKSSLLNRLNPQLALKEGDVSEKLSRGQHTTRHVELLAVSSGIVVADTPGFSRASFEDVSTETLRQVFPEIHHAALHCEFSNCLHVEETGCAVPEWVEHGKISAERWAHYKTFIAESMAGEEARRAMSDKSEYGEKVLRTRGGKAASRVKLNETLRGQSRRQARQALQPHALDPADYNEDDES